MQWQVNVVIRVFLAIAASSAQASTYAQEKMRCPVGGKSFTATVQMSSSSFGSRPDGRAYTTGLAPPPECPDNGFVFYKGAYSAAEVAKLTPIVTGAEYQRLRTTDPIHYRRYWLMKQMGEPVDNLAEALLVASWNRDDDPSQKARYQKEYVTIAQTLTPQTKDYFWFQARAADLWRELGDHAQSDALIRKIEPYVAQISDAADRKGWQEYLGKLRTLNAENVTAGEPVTMIPDMVAAEICSRKLRPLSASEAARCESAEMQALIKQYDRNAASVN